MKYRAEIDGLRALAVIPVILFHAGFETFSGGFVGVDVFFVISGYLITTILINEIESKKFSIVNFYERRARRILPALFFVMIVSIPLAWMWMLPNQTEDFAQSLIAVSLFSSNILFWQESGYFAAATEEMPLLHTWSLAVEEQYYLLFPIFLLLGWRLGKTKIVWIIALIALLSFFISEWGWRNNPSANFYLIPTRAWELLSGSISAFIIHKRGLKNNNVLSLLGLTAILFSIFTYDKNIPFPSAYTLLPVLGVVFLILYADKKTFVAKLLGTKLPVSIGLISYSAYLWHQPLFSFARIRLTEYPSQLLMLTLSLASIALAAFTWKYIEQPARTHLIPSKIIFSGSIFLILTFICCGFFMSYAAYNIHSKGAFYKQTKRNMYESMKTDQCHNWISIKHDLNRSIPQKCQSDHAQKIYLLGDSHALNLHNIIFETNQNTNLISYATGGCRYTDFRYEHCESLYETFRKSLKDLKPNDLIIYHQAFSQFIVDNNDKEMFYNYSKFNSSENKVSTTLLKKVFSELEQISKDFNHEIIWLGPWPEPRSKNLLSWNKHAFNYFSEFDDIAFLIGQDFEQVKYLRFSDAFKLSFIDLMENSKDCLIFQDSNHLSDCGEKYIAGTAINLKELAK